MCVQRGDARLSLDTWCEVRDAWQDGVTSLPPGARVSFLRDAAAMLHKHLNLKSVLTCNYLYIQLVPPVTNILGRSKASVVVLQMLFIAGIDILTCPPNRGSAQLLMQLEGAHPGALRRTCNRGSVL